MNDTARRFFWVSAYAVAMAFLEAVVVVYIRGLLHLTEDQVTLGPYVTKEIWREVATLVMLVAVGWSGWPMDCSPLRCGTSGTTVSK